MKIFSISDYHASEQVLGKLTVKIKETKPDIIVFTGDIVKGSPCENKETYDIQTYFKFYEWLNSLNIPSFVIPGNMDAPSELYFKTVMEAEGIYQNIFCVHGRSLRIGKAFSIGGLGGEITEDKKDNSFMQQFPVWEAKYLLGNLVHEENDKILLLHTPPVSKVDIENGKHKGSKVVNELLESLSPSFAFCGHAHYAQGQDKIGKTIIVNSGTLKQGKFAIVDTKSKKVELGSV